SFLLRLPTGRVGGSLIDGSRLLLHGLGCGSGTVAAEALTPGFLSRRVVGRLGDMLSTVIAFARGVLHAIAEGIALASDCVVLAPRHRQQRAHQRPDRETGAGEHQRLVADEPGRAVPDLPHLIARIPQRVFGHVTGATVTVAEAFARRGIAAFELPAGLVVPAAGVLVPTSRFSGDLIGVLARRPTATVVAAGAATDVGVEIPSGIERLGVAECLVARGTAGRLPEGRRVLVHSVVRVRRMIRPTVLILVGEPAHGGIGEQAEADARHRQGYRVLAHRLACVPPGLAGVSAIVSHCFPLSVRWAEAGAAGVSGPLAHCFSRILVHVTSRGSSPPRRSRPSSTPCCRLAGVRLGGG